MRHLVIAALAGALAAGPALAQGGGGSGSGSGDGGMGRSTIDQRSVPGGGPSSPNQTGDRAPGDNTSGTTGSMGSGAGGTTGSGTGTTGLGGQGGAGGSPGSGAATRDGVPGGTATSPAR
jgi:hypothetical protein